MDERAQKISATMKAKKLDNFRSWREAMRKRGVFGTPHKSLTHSGDLAEFIGVVLGDGNISTFPRTERLIISCDHQKPKFVERYADITEKLFMKKPTVSKVPDVGCIRISIYQRGISQRLGVPAGNRAAFRFRLPKWIGRSKPLLIRFLRGLYEAEGSISYHPQTYTHKFLFANRNQSLLAVVLQGLCRLGFHPHLSRDKVQLSRRSEVQECMKLLQFRKYDIIR